jgi:uncharacterized protein YfcZ (UPF0381/DUF406 family)
VSDQVIIKLPILADDAKQLSATIIFEYSAEKLIFELRSRTLAKK